MDRERDVWAAVAPLRLRWWMWAGYLAAFVVYGPVLRNLPAFAWFHLGFMQPGIGL